MADLSPKDYEILDFIQKQMQLKGFPPSVREICTAVGLTSTATIHARLKKLEKAGKITKESSKNRSLRIVEPNASISKNDTFSGKYFENKYLEVPIYGKVTAGEPITAIQDFSDTFPLPMDFAKNKELFMLKVQGESMINAAIVDGDYIIVQRQQVANNGDIVVALIDHENATVKTFYKEKGHFRLQPENDTMEPIIVSEVAILGKVVGVFRRM